LFADPRVAAGDTIEIDVYQPGEKILGEANYKPG